MQPHTARNEQLHILVPLLQRALGRLGVAGGYCHERGVAQCRADRAPRVREAHLGRRHAARRELREREEAEHALPQRLARRDPRRQQALRAELLCGVGQEGPEGAGVRGEVYEADPELGDEVQRPAVVQVPQANGPE